RAAFEGVCLDSGTRAAVVARCNEAMASGCEQQPEAKGRHLFCGYCSVYLFGWLWITRTAGIPKATGHIARKTPRKRSTVAHDLQRASSRHELLERLYDREEPAA